MKIMIPLMISLIVFSCRSNHSEIEFIDSIKTQNKMQAKQLLSQGININYRDKDDKTALDYAVMSQEKETIELLLVNGATIHKKTINIASTLDTTLLSILIEHIQKDEFKKARNKNIIKSYSEFIRSYPESKFTDIAIDSLRKILLRPYPMDKYYNNISKDDFKSRLIESLVNNMPFLLTITPKLIKYNIGYSWSVTFHEISGVRTEIYYMTPTITFPDEHYYTLRNANALKRSIIIKPYGTGTHRYSWHTRSESTDIEARLRYQAKPVNGSDRISVTSFTRLQK